MSCPPAEPAGLLLLAVGMVASCVVVMVTTNRKFGHQTFHNSSQREDGKSRRRGSSGSSNGNSSSRNNNASSNSRHVFEGLSESGVLEAVSSFLSPADLAGIATVSADFCRASASNFLWRCHWERAFGGSKPPLLGERHDNHLQHQEMQERRDRGRPPRLQHKQPRGDTAAERRCRCGGSRARRQQHRRRQPTEDGGSGSGSGSECASPALHFLRSCSDPTCCNYSWREAFFRAHRAKPRDLLRELSRSATASTSTQQPPPAPPPPTRRPCVIVLHGRVHDLTEFLPSHPGGSLILREHAFTDATIAFERFFHSREARRMARQFVVWDGQAVMGRRGTLWKAAQQLSP